MDSQEEKCSESGSDSDESKIPSDSIPVEEASLLIPQKRLLFTLVSFLGLIINHAAY